MVSFESDYNENQAETEVESVQIDPDWVVAVVYILPQAQFH